MSPAPSVTELLRSIGLEVDGPLRWGSRPGSREPGIFVVEALSPEPSAHIDIDAVRRWLERVPSLRMDDASIPLFVDRAVKEKLVERFRWFLGAEAWHTSRGIPWKLGILSQRED